MQVLASVLDTVPPLIPPPAWNNQPLPCAPMLTGLFFARGMVSQHLGAMVVVVRRPRLLWCSALPNHHGRFHNSGRHRWDVGRTAALHWLAWRLNYCWQAPLPLSLVGFCTSKPARVEQRFGVAGPCLEHGFRTLLSCRIHSWFPEHLCRKSWQDLRRHV